MGMFERLAIDRVIKALKGRRIRVHRDFVNSRGRLEKLRQALRFNKTVPDAIVAAKDDDGCLYIAIIEIEDSHPLTEQMYRRRCRVLFDWDCADETPAVIVVCDRWGNIRHIIGIREAFENVVYAEL